MFCRSIIYFVFLGDMAHLSALRIPGVLQKLAATYLAVALLEIPFACANDQYEVQKRIISFQSSLLNDLNIIK